MCFSPPRKRSLLREVYYLFTRNMVNTVEAVLMFQQKVQQFVDECVVLEALQCSTKLEIPTPEGCFCC